MPWPFDNKPVSPIANAMLAPQPAMANALQRNAMSAPQVGPSDTSRYPVFPGELGADKKVITPDGRVGASAFLTIRPDSVDINDINTHPDFRRQGYASALVDDLFKEFPGKRIVGYGITDKGMKFFGARYNVGADGTLTQKGERAIGAGILGGALKGPIGDKEPLLE